MAGTCVGLVSAKLGFPRGVVVRGTDIYVADMGGWGANRGRLIKLPGLGHGPAEVLLRGLNRPNGLALGPDGKLYIGFANGIVSLNPDDAHPALTKVVTGLPSTGRHPLTALVVAPDGTLFINVGSVTNNCEAAGGAPPDPASPCPETSASPPRAAIFSVAPQPGHAVPWQSATLVARGLRNSMGLAILPNGKLVAAVNARDYINAADSSLADDAEPHDTLDVIQPGRDYGWPYCFDDNRPSPEYPSFDCSVKQKPSFLLPAHAAPLGLLVYAGKAIPALAGTLLIPYHGYRPTGHRLMAMTLDAAGGLTGALKPVVWGWDHHPGANPQGAPVALAELPDGSVLVTEDLNGSLLRLAPQ